MSKRSIFEDVKSTGPKTVAPAKSRRDPARQGIFVWLMMLALLVAVMVVVGGATRLTDSGLSITEWAPVIGTLPPLSQGDWDAAFAAYKTTTEFQEQNSWMTLEDFKPIFWWEWGHRFFGRLIGLIWFVGFAGFLVLGRIPDGWTVKLLLPGVLGGIQGSIGWWMVASGLTGRLDVAPYRLAVHLGLAVFIFGLLLWLAMRVLRDPVETLARRRTRLTGPMRWSGLMLGLVFVQVLSGALVAGLDAGQAFTDWPLMAGEFFPATALDLQPIWVNFFENPGLAQFNHRMVAYLILFVSVGFLLSHFRAPHPKVRAWGWRCMIIVGAQIALGIATLAHSAPVHLAIAHQFLALLLIGALVHARFEAGYPSPQRISA
ncbi:MAG: COX15/CtaA family protein [Pseudomonadota bacterium]